MSGFDARREYGPIPAAMVLATVFAGGVVLFWAWIVVILVFALRALEGPTALWTLGSTFATAAGVVGMIGCLRRWVWVRWAALVQAVVVGAVLGFVMLVWPFVGWIIVLLVAYAGLQFLPSSHRWYHPTPDPGS